MIDWAIHSSRTTWVKVAPKVIARQVKNKKLIRERVVRRRSRGAWLLVMAPSMACWIRCGRISVVPVIMKEMRTASANGDA